jgi:predicted AlkP superfamily pyrophosphatase or phosphodiesterase
MWFAALQLFSLLQNKVKNMKKIIGSAVLLLSVLFTSAQVPASPKLVVGIVVDQMRYDYIYRYWNKFGEDGFKRLVNEGFSCKNTAYNYVPTYTGPGHASVYTGTTPAIHGIIGNIWYDRVKGKKVYCTEDPTVKGIGSDSHSSQMSPALMLATTITDQLRLSNSMGSKVISISIKDRSAILPGGHTANAAYWYNALSGKFITSSYYVQQLPAWVEDFNKKQMPDIYLSKPWNTLLPIDQYTESLSDDNKYEGLFKGESKPVFPHNLPEIKKQSGYDLLSSTPFGNTFTKDFAIEAIKFEQLGKGKFTDFLAISFSPTDYVGHQFGTNSVEVEDTYLRLDKDIADLLKFLDNNIGKNNFLVFLTADHAAVESPSYLHDLKIPSGNFNSGDAVGSLKYFFKNTYGDSLVEYYTNQQFYLKRKVIEEKKLNMPEVLQKGADYLMRFEGVAGTLTAITISNSGINDGIGLMIKNGYSQKRSGDIVVNLEPGWVEWESTGTTHGSPYSYDTHVPLIWFGWKIRQGNSSEPVNITDIASTLADLLNIQAPNGCTGKPIPFLTK